MENKNVMLCIANPLSKTISEQEIQFMQKVIFEINRSYPNQNIYVYLRHLPEHYVNYLDQWLSDLPFISKIFLQATDKFTEIVDDKETLISGISFNGEHVNKLENTNRMISYMRFNV